MYYALFVDNASNSAWIGKFPEGVPPQRGCHSGQSFGDDRQAAVEACRKLQARGYQVAPCDLE